MCKLKFFRFKNILFYFKKTFSLQMVYKQKRFRFKNNSTFVSKTLSLCKWFKNKIIFV